MKCNVITKSVVIVYLFVVGLHIINKATVSAILK